MITLKLQHQEHTFSFNLDGTTLTGCKLAPIVEVKEYYFNGLCYAVNFPKCLRDLGILEMAVNFREVRITFLKLI